MNRLVSTPHALALVSSLLAATLAVGSTAGAQAVAGPASDLLTTPAGSTMDDHFLPSAGGAPIPAGFFGPGSDPFTGSIRLHGRPLEGTPSMAPTGVGIPGQADTIVHRLAATPPLPCPGTAVVPIEIVALSLVSVQPITVTFGGGASSSTYEVMVCLSRATPQPQGQMQIVRTNVHGGVFSSSLPVIPRFIFTKCSGAPGVPEAILDPGPGTLLSTPPTAQGKWSYTNLGLDILGSPGGTVDHDCNPLTPPVPYLPTSNFFVGVSAPLADCVFPGVPPPIKEITAEQAMLAAHGVLPPCLPPGTAYCFGDGTGVPCPCGNLGDPGHGCETSLGTGGGILFGYGDAKVSADTLVLRIEDIGASTPVLLFQGTAGSAGFPFGDGLRCVIGSIRRFPIAFAVCGKVNYGLPVGTVPISLTGAIPAAGGTFFYQGWFRDAAIFCTPDTFNLTNGYSVLWIP